MKKKIVALALVLALVVSVAVGLAACNKSDGTLIFGPEDADITFGMICLHDENSTYDKNFIDAARDLAEEKQVRVIVKTGIPESAACYDAAVDLVDQGCDIIFADSFGHEDHVVRAAREFPEVQFAHATGTKAHTNGVENYHNGFASIYEGRYLAGIVAAVVVLVVPQLIECVKLLIDEVPVAAVALFDWLEESDLITPDLVNSVTASLEAFDWRTRASELAGVVMSGVVGAVSGVVSGTATFFLAVIFSIFVLLNKRRLAIQRDLIMERYLSAQTLSRVRYVLGIADDCFHRFLVGQCTEAVVLGVLCALGMFALQLPYALMIGALTAFMALTTAILISSITLRYPHEFILLQTAAGLVALFSLRELSQRSQLFRSAFLIVLSYAATYFAYELVHESDLSKLNAGMYVYFIVNGVLLLFTYPLLFAVEKTFGFTSNVTLVELSNVNNRLLRRMSEIAPGTFQHSMQVANLAAEAAHKIGANSQLVRTGALYHDIGKMENPAFFTENQSGVNPHERLGYEESAQIVISHVADGLRLADKHNLPKAVKDFISTHHGRGKTKYFYISYKNAHPGEPVDEAKFTYPGPNPFTKETAILMMADSVEAASRSLSQYTEESISGLVDKIIDAQVEEGFFRECPITFKDIATVKAVFKEKLKTMYHTRIKYPELNRK